MPSRDLRRMEDEYPRPCLCGSVFSSLLEEGQTYLGVLELSHPAGKPAADIGERDSARAGGEGDSTAQSPVRSRVSERIGDLRGVSCARWSHLRTVRRFGRAAPDQARSKFQDGADLLSLSQCCVRTGPVL